MRLQSLGRVPIFDLRENTIAGHQTLPLNFLDQDSSPLSSFTSHTCVLQTAKQVILNFNIMQSWALCTKLHHCFHVYCNIQRADSTIDFYLWALSIGWRSKPLQSSSVQIVRGMVKSTIMYLHLALDTVCMFDSSEDDPCLCFAGFLAVFVTVVEFFAHKFICLYLAL